MLHLLKITFKYYMVEEIDGYDGKPVIASMGAGNRFKFDEGAMLQLNHHKIQQLIYTSVLLYLKIGMLTDLYQTFVEDKIRSTSVLSHEIMHRFHRQKQRIRINWWNCGLSNIRFW